MANLKPAYVDIDSGALVEPRNNDKLINDPDVTVDSITELQESNISKSIYVRTKTLKLLGYNEPGDNGGGTVYWDANRDKQDHNAITVFSPTHSASTWGDTQDANWYSADGTDTGTGAWVRDVGDYITLEQAGAIPDQTSSGWDSTVAVQAAIDIAFSLGVDIRLSPKQFNASIVLKDNTKLKGALTSKITRPSGYTDLLIDSDNNVSDVTIENVRFDDALNETRLGEIKSPKNFTLKNCVFNNLLDQFNKIHLTPEGDTIADNVLIEDNTFNAVENTSGSSFLMFACLALPRGLTMRENRFNNIAGMIQTVSSSVASGSVGGNIRIEKNKVDMAPQTLFQSRSNSDVILEDIWVKDNIYKGMYNLQGAHGFAFIAHTLDGVTGNTWRNINITGNVIRGEGLTNDTDGIALGGGAGSTDLVDGVTIKDNFIDLSPIGGDTDTEARSIGIQLQGVNVVRNATIYNNDIKNCGRAGIMVNGSDNIRVISNNIENVCIGNVESEFGGVYVLRGTDVTISDNTISNVGNDVATQLSGIALEDNTDSENVLHTFNIKDNIIYDDRDTPQMVYGIRIGSADLAAGNQPSDVICQGNKVYGTVEKEIIHFRTLDLAGELGGYLINNNMMGDDRWRTMESSATPNVNSEEFLVTDFGGDITDLLEGYPGQEVTIMGGAGGNPTFIHDGTILVLKGATNRQLNTHETIKFVRNYDNSRWAEV